VRRQWVLEARWWDLQPGHDGGRCSGPAGTQGLGIEQRRSGGRGSGGRRRRSTTVLPEPRAACEL
jgi:hypothetical protein